MLINLSNHPSSSWSEKQIAAAEKAYGKVTDLEFPLIPPDADEEIIKRLAEDYKDICLDIISSSENKNNVVHIMGEMTFCFALIRLLKKEKVTCIASTTNRLVSDENNTKTSYFNFVRFREYK